MAQQGFRVDLKVFAAGATAQQVQYGTQTPVGPSRQMTQWGGAAPQYKHVMDWTLTEQQQFYPFRGTVKPLAG